MVIMMVNDDLVGFLLEASSFFPSHIVRELSSTIDLTTCYFYIIIIMEFVYFTKCLMFDGWFTSTVVSSDISSTVPALSVTFK